MSDNWKQRLFATFLRWRPWLFGMLAVTVGVLLYEALHSLLSELSYAEMVQAIRATPATDLWLAFLAVLASYWALTGYDASSLRFAGVELPYRSVAKTSFIAYALTNTIGLGVLTGGAVRMRMYGAAGIEAGKVTRIIAFNAAAFTIGITVVGAAALVWGAHDVAPALHLPSGLLRAVSGAILGASALMLVLCALGPELKWGPLKMKLPPASLVLQQLLFSAVDIAATAAVLWLLLPNGVISFLPFVAFFAIAIVAGVLSHVPGGLGVFEAVMLVALSGKLPMESLASALILYRLLYFVLPLLAALFLLVRDELRHEAVAPITAAAASLAPLLLAAFSLVVGLVLLVSGVTPATPEGTQMLMAYVPEPLVEASHFFGSIAGLGLLFVARGMLLRLDAAWWAGIGLGIASLLFALPKGIAVSEATLIGSLVVALALSRKQFTRRTSLLAQPFTGGWLVAVGAIVMGLIGLLFVAYHDVDYAQELWWKFEFDAHASRSLRAITAISLIALVLALRQLLRPPAPRPRRPDAAEVDKAAAVVSKQDTSEAGLALMGDKPFLFSESGQAFVMYGRRRGSWIGLFDPVGPQDEREEMVWRFVEQVHEAGGRPAFYQVRPQHLPLYLDAGLRVYKLGEAAHVSLPDFSLKGKRRANLRHGCSRAEREGLSFELIPVERVPEVLADLRAISDAWLSGHDAAEKGFSLGAFDESYLKRHPVGVLRKEGQIVAFANLLSTEAKVEASIDLMRQSDKAPPGTMDYLFVQLMLHCQAQGFQRFGLGMAPLSGMAEHPLAPNWHRFGRMLFAHGENFYNFQGLRSFKEKFDPVWEPRYLAAPGGVTPLIVLTDIAALISGGLRGVFAK